MYRGLSISLVIPCYNEEQGIKKVIESVPDYVDEVIAIDNNSTDHTAEVARSLGAKVVSEPRHGYGYAYQRGFRESSKDIIVTGDADGTYPIWDARKIIDYMLENNLDFVSGNRFPIKNKESMPLANYIGNMILSFAVFLFFWRRIKDSQSGMWVFKKEILSRIELTSGGMPLSEELKIEAMLHPEIRFAEYHIDYFRRIGKAKLVKWKDGWQNLKFIVRKRFSLWRRKRK